MLQSTGTLRSVGGEMGLYPWEGMGEGVLPQAKPFLQPSAPGRAVGMGRTPFTRLHGFSEPKEPHKKSCPFRMLCLQLLESFSQFPCELQEPSLTFFSPSSVPGLVDLLLPHRESS